MNDKVEIKINPKTNEIELMIPSKYREKMDKEESDCINNKILTIALILSEIENR